MITSYEVRARKFANDIYPYINNCKSPFEFETAVSRFNRINHRAVRVAYGQTRVALITSDYVLKIDYGTRSSLFGGCENEYQAYQKAYHDGFAYLFAKISPVMVKERVFYIMPRIERIGIEFNGFDEAWDVVKSDDERDYLYDNFSDLHHENFGWKHGKPVIVDYACCSRRD